MCSIVSVGTSLTVAVFLILLSFAWFCTFTLNSTVFVSPAFRCTVIPSLKFSSLSCVETPPTLTLPVTNVVPVGTVSFTITSAGAVPVLLSNVIVYVIICPSTTVPFSGFAVLCAIAFGFFTVSVTVSVSLSSTIATFFIVSVSFPSGKFSTSTSNVNVSSPLAGIFTVIPSSNSSFPKLSVFDLLLILMLPSTNLVPLGILSIIVTSFPKSPSFFTVIVYLILSPSNA